MKEKKEVLFNMRVTPAWKKEREHNKEELGFGQLSLSSYLRCMIDKGEEVARHGHD